MKNDETKGTVFFFRFFRRFLFLLFLLFVLFCVFLLSDFLVLVVLVFVFFLVLFLSLAFLVFFCCFLFFLFNVLFSKGVVSTFCFCFCLYLHFLLSCPAPKSSVVLLYSFFFLQFLHFSHAPLNLYVVRLLAKAESSPRGTKTTSSNKTPNKHQQKRQTNKTGRPSKQTHPQRK